MELLLNPLIYLYSDVGKISRSCEGKWLLSSEFGFNWNFKQFAVSVIENSMEVMKNKSKVFINLQTVIDWIVMFLK